MRRILLTLLPAAAAAFGAPAAGPVGPVGSSACRAALAVLEQQEALAAVADDAARRAAVERVRARRRDAARACLGGNGDPPLPTATLQAPVTVIPGPAPAVRPVQPPRTVPVPVVTLPAPQPPTVPTITSCDATFCRTSDGALLQRHGGNVIGPRGLCSPVPGAPC